MFYLLTASIGVHAVNAARATSGTPAVPTSQQRGSNSLDPFLLFNNVCGRFDSLFNIKHYKKQ